MEKPFFTVLWTRWRIRKLDELVQKFEKDYLVTMPRWIIYNRLYDWWLGGHLTRYEIHVKADSLHAFLSSIRAVLYQKEPQPFTLRDHRLFELISMIYPSNRELPFGPKIEHGGRWRIPEK